MFVSGADVPDNTDQFLRLQGDSGISALEVLSDCGDYVRLVGLKTASLNGSIGTVCSSVDSSGRVGVLLAGSSSPKALKAENLIRYEYSSDDRCAYCHKNINLFAFPPCSCGGRSISDLNDGNNLHNYVPRSSGSSKDSSTRANLAYAKEGLHR